MTSFLKEGIWIIAATLMGFIIGANQYKNQVIYVESLSKCVEVSK